MKTIASTRKAIRQLAERIKETYAPDTIILFGSYAYGQPDADSDIDLLIVKKTHLPFHKRWAEVCRSVSPEASGLDFSPFVVTPEELEERLKIGDQFFQEVLTKGKVLYAR